MKIEQIAKVHGARFRALVAKAIKRERRVYTIRALCFHITIFTKASVKANALIVKIKNALSYL